MTQQDFEAKLAGREHCLLIGNTMQPIPVSHPESGKAHKLLASHLSERFAFSGTTEFAGIEDCADNCALVSIFDDFPGRSGRSIVQIVETPGIYYSDVNRHVPLATMRLNERLELAKRTGFLLMGPDESIAVCLAHEDTPESLIVAAFLTDEHCQPRAVTSISNWNLSRYTVQTTVSSLNQEQVKTALRDTEEELLYEQASESGSATRIARLKESLNCLIAHAAVAEPARTASGAVVRRWFIEGGSTSSIHKLTPTDKGWIDYPTGQDAWYFGIRINPATREVMTYAEQDVSHVLCEDQRQFMDELKDMARFYGPSRKPCARAYDIKGSVTRFYDNYFQLSGKLGIFAFANDDIATAGSEAAPLFGALWLEHPIFEAMAHCPDVEFHVPADAMELDLLHPLAFEQYQCTALIHAGGIDVEVVFASGQKVVGMYETKEEVAA